MLETYRQSLKMPEAEEAFDLIFYRPLAYLLVVPLSKTPITPNQITILSLLAGLVAAYYFSIGIPSALMLGALWYTIANILDCADGQLARIKKNGTPLGRLVDGIADYISSVAIFLGIGYGLETVGNPQWWFVIAAGISSALHAIKFDEVQCAYIANAKGVHNIPESEMIKYFQLMVAEQSWLKRSVIGLYISYLKFQSKTSNRKPQTTNPEPRIVNQQTKRMVRLWGWLGPTTNRTLLIVSVLLGNLELFPYGVVVAGNCYMIYLMIRKQGSRV
ncbi:MAG: CDP-alcohol phosphatidyltransferase family protein [Ignavibacteriae bacterium]|nr:CDP-alcohol phosphatidyltransferase family protein [Ignavibacteriota bacterium]